MKLLIFSWLLLLINELRANPATQKYAGYLRNNANSHVLKARKIEPSPTTYAEHVPDYPKAYIQQLNLEKFEHLFVDDFMETLDLRFDADEVGLCSSRRRITYPQKGITPDGIWLTIINNDNGRYRQGVLVEECDQPETACQYSQNFPLSVETKCKQSYTYRTLAALNSDGNVESKPFRFPSCCKCFVTVGHRSVGSRGGGDDKSQKGIDSDKIYFPH